MSLRNLDQNSQSGSWDSKWAEIFDHYQQDLRHAHYIRALMNADEASVLEIAAGSFRDMAALRRMGIECSGMDFSPESVSRAKAAFPQYADQIHLMSAFEMPVADGAFDLSYHNGFWILFSDDNIRALAAEQARVSRRRMVVTVHNGHNRQFVDYFDRLKINDPLYDIRFFEVDEVVALMEPVCRDVQVVPVGKGKRKHEDLLIKHGWTHPGLLRTYLKLSGHRLLDSSERLLCIGTPR